MAPVNSTQRNSIAGAVAAAVLVTRASDAALVPRLVLDKQGSPKESLQILASVVMLYGYEKATAAVLRKLGITKLPSTLAAMLSLFVLFRTTMKVAGRDTSDAVSKFMGPGVGFLGKWMSIFVAPPLSTLDASISLLPAYGAAVWGKVVAFLTGGWAATHALSASMATSLQPRHMRRSSDGSMSAVSAVSSDALAAAPTPGQAAAAAPGTAVAKAEKKPKMSQEEVLRRAWLFLGALSYLGVSFFPVLPKRLHRPIGSLCQLCTTVGVFMYAKLLPTVVQQALHPLVVCAISTNLSTRFVGDAAPFLNNGIGAGDRLFQLLPAAMAALGVRMYDTAHLWYDKADSLRCVLLTCSISGLFSLVASGLAGLPAHSPFSLPNPLALPFLHREVMTALAIENAKATGPECDPKISVASALVTGCIGASFGNSLLLSCPSVFDAESSLVRGVATGCSAISTGTASLIAAGDTEAGAIAGISMCLSATAHTLALQIPGVIPAIRQVALLPPLAA